MNKINKLNFLRILSYLGEGFTFDEIQSDFYKCDLIDVIYDCVTNCDNEQLIEIIWYLVCEDFSYAVYDIAEVLEIEEEEMYWL